MVWRRKGDRFKAGYTVPTVGQQDGIMVWAAMNGRGEVIVRKCPPKVNGLGYQAILKTAMRFIKPRCVCYHWVSPFHSEPADTASSKMGQVCTSRTPRRRG